MRVLYYIPHPKSIGAAHWIYKGWKHAFEDLGHRFLELTASDDMEAKVGHERPDIVFFANLIDFVALRHTLVRMRKAGTMVFLVLSWPLSQHELEVIRDHDMADVYFGEREEAEYPRKFREATGREYHVIPYAADSRLNFPTTPGAKYRYDIVYLGAYLPKKKRAFEEVLQPLKGKYRVGCVRTELDDERQRSASLSANGS